MTQGLDPRDLAQCLRILALAEQLPPEHPDAVAVRRATARIYKSVRKARRDERRDAIHAADRAVVGATATGSAQRIDDETEGIPLASNVPGAIAGRYRRPLSPAASLLHLQAALHAGRCVLPPALSVVRGGQPPPPRGHHRP